MNQVTGRSSARPACATLCALAFALVTSAQCALPTTGGARTTVGMTLGATRPRGPNGRGWSLALDVARARVAWVRLSEGMATARARPRRAPWLDRARGGLGVAHAHPGHYTPGEALADATPLRVIDLLAAPVELGPAPAVTGTVRSASLALRPGEGEGLPTGASVLVEGVASREGVRVRFRGRIDGPVDIEGAPADGTIAEAPRARASVRIDLGAWLARVDFAPLARAGLEGAAVELRADPEADNAWSRGVRDGAAYRFDLTEEDGR